MATVFVIDDEADQRDFVVKALNLLGHDATSISQTDLVLLARRDPDFDSMVDLVLTDVFMPGSDGIDVMLALKRDRPTCKIIAMSGGGDFGAGNALQLARSFGADATLAKPFTIADLRDTVARVLSA